MPELKSRIVFDEDLKRVIKKVVTTLAKAVKGTLGPKGTNVGVKSEIALPIIVNDGVTVVKKITAAFTDDLEKYVANVIKTASVTTEEVAGDGTTTATTLTEAIILNGLKLIEAGYSAVDVVKGIHAATKLVLKELESKATPVSDDLLLKVATISANNDDDLGKLIADAFSKVGVNGQIEIKDDIEDTYVEFVDGMKYESGFESQMFINTDVSEVYFSKPKVLIFEGKLVTIDSIIDILREVRNRNESLLIIADDYSKTAIEDLANNKVNYSLQVCAVKSPGYGISKEADLEDIAFASGGKIASRRYGIEIDQLTYEDLGEVEVAKINQGDFSLLTSNKEGLAERIETLKKESKKVKGTPKQEILDRIAKLSNGVAILYLSGNTDVEIAEKKLRAEDAINATRASIEEGILPGGGIALLKASKAVKTTKMANTAQDLGFEALLDSLEAPLQTIAKNSGVSGDVKIQEVLKGEFNYGYNAKTDKFEDLIESGVVDPKKVTRAALQNSSSVAQMILTMNCVIY